MWAVVPLLTSNLTAVGLFALPFTYDQTELPKAIAVLSLTWLGLLLAVVSTGPAGHLRRPAALLPLAGFLLVALLSAVFSVSPAHAFLGSYGRYGGWLTLATYATMYVYAVQVLGPSRWRIMARAAVYTGGVVSLYGLLQVAGIDPTDWLAVPFAERSFSTYGNPDFLGAYLVFPIGLGLALTLAEKDTRWRTLAAAATLLCLLCSVTTLARSGWIGAIVTVAIVLVGSRRTGAPVKRIFVGLLVATVAVSAVMVLTSPVNPMSRVVTLIGLSDPGVTGRMVIWRAGMQAFADRPILGSGPDTFFYAAEPYLHEHVERIDRAHNYPLQMLVTTGFMGGLLLFTFMVTVLIRSAPHAFRGVREYDADPGRTRAFIYLGVWAAVVGFLAALLAGISLPGVSVFLWMSLGVLAYPLSSRTLLLQGVPRVAATSVLVLVLASAGYLSARALAADAVFLDARVAARSGGDYAGLMREAVRLNPIPERYQRELEIAESLE